uniref:Anoctamin n=2 Tax=Ixodes scapularis TaxID=6945 RepID=A0A1S4LHD0_IXOSC
GPLCFDDGKRRIDFVLAFGKGGGSVAEDTRKVFEQNLLEAGLELERVDGHVSAAEKITFVKIHAPWDVITKYAEMLHLMMPVKVMKMELDAAKQAAGTLKGCVRELGSRICTPWPYNRRLIPDEQEFHNAEFYRQREGAFLITDQETFFTPAMRSRIVWEVLTQTAYDEQGREKGINKLLNRDIYLAAYPLHDGPCGTGPINTRVEARTERRLLYSEWARLEVCYREQPIQLIRRYFGVKTGLYFTWLGFYTGMLLLPAIVGILTAIYGVVMLTVNVPVMETCDPKIFGNLVLCPACKKSCPYDHLSNKCTFTKIVYLFENPATVAFSIFMALWATIFMEMWKRRQAVLKWEWKLSDLDTLSNLIKPDYEARARVYRLNPVTMNYEPYVPLWERILRISGTTSVLLLMLLLALIAVFGIITYRIILTGLLLRDKQWRQFAPLTTAVTASTLNLVIILIMDRIYARIAKWLTYIEVPRTEEEYEDRYTVKMFLFNFFNTYSSLFYIAFLKGR